jgi:hypothetical protein
MSQDPHIYHTSQNGSYSPYPSPRGSYPPPYASPQPIRLEPYPSQPTIYAQYPPQIGRYSNFFPQDMEFFFLNQITKHETLLTFNTLTSAFSFALLLKKIFAF